jgi:ACT domain-containing protein
MKKALIVVYGKDRTGIIYNVTKILFDNNINVLDIKQTIVDGYFNMMTIADVSKSKTLNKVKKALEEYGKKSSLSINFQLEDAFLAMHNL